MKLQDIKTLDELFDFFKAARFYKVNDAFPFDIEEIVPLGYPLIKIISSEKIVRWELCEHLGFSENTLFDDFKEAKEYELRKRMAYTKKMLDDDKAELKNLKEETRNE